VPSALSRRVGPLPVWGWVVGALVAFLVISRRNRPGWFPLSVSSTSGGGGLGARVGLAIGNFRDSGDDETEEPPGSGEAWAGRGRDTQPSPITAGGPDGTVYSGGGGAPAPSRTIGLYGPGGMYTYTGTSRTRSGGSYPGSGGPIGYGGGRGR
jgi:hypothetical protein